MTTDHSDDAVELALSGEYETLCAAIARFTSPEELHRFSRRYNVNDGLEPLCCVVGHPECDAGTALFIYWQFHELLDQPAIRAATDNEHARWNAHALLSDIEQRYPRGFRHQGIAYDPVTDFTQAFGEAYVEGIRALHAGSPLMDPLGAMGKEGRS